MGTKTKIEWANHTFNPWIGCEPVSEGCRNCYAATQALRFSEQGGTPWQGAAELRGGRAVFTGRLNRTSPKNWQQPLRWHRDAKARQDAWRSSIAHFTDGERDAIQRGFHKPARPRVFCASLADWLHEEAPAEWLFDLITLIHKTPDLDWLLLTKRPQDWASRLRAAAAQCTVDPLDITDRIYAWIEGSRIWTNVWVGTTVENQQAADERIPHLLKIPARVRFLSCEPLLGPVELMHIGPSNTAAGIRTIDWVIAGGESGANARPMHPDWARGLRDQCQAAGVPFLFKQWGEFGPSPDCGLPDDLPEGAGYYFPEPHSPQKVWRFGKATSGRLFDGREWNEVPT